MPYYPFKSGSSYTPESYIYNIGNCGFNTNHIHTADTKIIFKAQIEPFYAPYGYGQVFGARSNNYSANAFGFFGRFNGNRYCLYRTGKEQVGDMYDTQSLSAPFLPFVPCIFTAEGNKIEWYNENDIAVVRSITVTGGNINGGIAPLAIFACNKSTQSNGWELTDYVVMKLYWFEIYENNVLIHRFIPAYNNSQYCLYDEVTQTYSYDTVNNGANVKGFIN